MASIERTAYPRFRRLVTARELASLSPSGDDVAWAREHTRSGEHLFSLVLSLVCFGQLGYFPRPGEVPVAVVEYVRRELGLPEGTAAWCEARNVKAQRQQVRGRLGVVHDPQRARAVAEAGIRSAAEVMNHPPDLINVALELIVKASLELPAFSTVDEIASRVANQAQRPQSTRRAGRSMDPPMVRGAGTSPAHGHHPLPRERVSHAKIIGEPCAGKPHARTRKGNEEPDPPRAGTAPLTTNAGRAPASDASTREMPRSGRGDPSHGRQRRRCICWPGSPLRFVRATPKDHRGSGCWLRHQHRAHCLPPLDPGSLRWVRLPRAPRTPGRGRASQLVSQPGPSRQSRLGAVHQRAFGG